MNAPLELRTLPAGTDRQKFLGGSDVAAIFGVSPWKTPYDLFLDKSTPRTGEEDLNEDRAKFFRRRKRQEPVIAEMLAEEYGIEVTRLSIDEDPNRYVDPEYPFMAAEVDFEFRMSEAVRAMFPGRPDFAAIPDGTLLNGEIKTVHPFKASEWGEEGSEEVPIHYAAQFMHGLGVTSRPGGIVAALFGLDNLVCFPVMRDEETIAAMRTKAVAFWTGNVLAGVPPAPSNVDDVKKMYSKFKGKPVDLSPEAHEALENLNAIRSRMRAFEIDKAECEWRIAQCIAFNWGVILHPPAQPGDSPDAPDVKDNAVLMHDGIQVGSWNRQRGTYLDQRRLATDRPEITKAYTVEHHYRKFTVKKGKK